MQRSVIREKKQTSLTQTPIHPTQTTDHVAWMQRSVIREKKQTSLTRTPLHSIQTTDHVAWMKRSVIRVKGRQALLDSVALHPGYVPTPSSQF
ncbi:MAG: hypothetical protein ABW104_21090 [Candidatus Thiodiazotropha sp. 6PLUC2]